MKLIIERRCLKREKKIGAERRSAYKFPRAQTFYDTLQTSQALDEMHELLAVGMEFSDFVMVKIEFEYHCQCR